MIQKQWPLVSVTLVGRGDTKTSKKVVVDNVLIDTGANSTYFAASILKLLHLKPSGTTHTYTGKGVKPNINKKYIVDMHIRQPHNKGVLTFLGVNIVSTGIFHSRKSQIQGIIGTDILERCILYYNGPEHQFSIHLPQKIKRL